jgi:uncharacterized protein involved in outer membrane biogenesis
MGKKVGLQVIAGLFLLYTCGGFFGVPYALKNIVPQKVSDATDGGKFAVESASFNPFLFQLDLHNFSFKTPSEGDFVFVKEFSINVNPIDYLWKRGLVIEDLKIIQPSISVAKDAHGIMNFAWLSKEEDNKTQEPSKPFPLLIKSFTLKSGMVDYKDISEGKNYHQQIDKMGFHLDNIDLRDMSTSKGAMRLYATINDGGFVDLRGKIDALKPFILKGSVEFDSGNLYVPWRYFRDKLPIEVADGKMDIAFDYALNGDDINATKLSNVQMGLHSLRLIPKGEEKKLLDIGNINVSNATIWPMRKVLDASSLKLDGLALSASRSHEGVIDWLDYMAQISKAFPDDENETKVPWSFSIGAVTLDNMKVMWTDNGPKNPYMAALEGISLSSQRVSSDPKKILNAQLKTGKMEMRRTADGSVVTGFETLTMGEISLDREAQNALIDKVQMEGMNVSLKRLRDGSIDLQQLLYTSNKKEVTTKGASKPWSYRVNEVALNNAHVGFVDEVPSPCVAVDLDELHIGVKKFTSNPRESMSIESSSKINQKTTLKTSSELRLETLQSKGSFELNHFSLPLIDPYIEPSTYAQLRRGDLGLSGTYAYTPEKMLVTGKLALEDWVVNDRRDASVLLGWNRIGVTPFVYAYPDNRLKVNQVSVDGLYTNVVIDQNKTLNFSTLSKAVKSDANVSAKAGNPFGIDVLKLMLQNSSATFSDLSLPLPFKTYTHDLGGEVLGISTTKDVTTFVKLRGGVDEYGSTKINGQLNTKAPKSFTDMHVAFENLELKQYTPYSLQFLGYKIADGKLFLNLGYKITDGKLNAQNQIIIKKIQLGEEKAGGSPWPMGLVVALLEDSDGIIDIDLPIEGDVNSPDFKYGKVVWQVIGNILTKAITSPFRLLGAMMGLEANDDSLSKISFEAGEAIISPPQREKLDKLTALLGKRPKLTLNVHGGWATEADERALRIQKLIRTVMGQHQKEGATTENAMSLEYLEVTAEKSMDSKELKELRNAMEEKHPKEPEFTHYYTAALIEKLIALQVLAKPDLDALASKRSSAIVEYLHKTPALQSRVTVGESEKNTFDAKDGVMTRLELSVH